MRQKNLIKFYVLFFLVIFFNHSSFTQTTNNTFQYSVISALMEGNFDGDLSFKELKKHGDFGLGTLNHLNGEMILLDDKFYQITSEGKVNLIPEESLTPFAVITYFKADESKNISDTLTLKTLINYIDGLIPSPNPVYAIRIEGTFSYIKTRSVPSQEKPYKKLVDVTKNQSVFEFNDIKGTLVGFRFPSYSDGINVPGYHFHFISDDKKSGGHVLDLKTKEIIIEIAKQNNLQISFPGNEDFMKIDLSKKNSEDLNKAEK